MRRPPVIPVFYLCLLVLILFSSCKTVNHFAYLTAKSYSMDSVYLDTAEKEMTQMIMPYKIELDKEMNEVVATCATDLYKAQPEGALGNWLADLTHTAAERYLNDKVDFAVYNHGGIRLPSLPAGSITRGKLFELMPFDNYLVVIRADYKIVKTLLNRMAQGGGWPVSKPLQYEIRDTIAENVLLNGAPLNPDKEYKIAISDYIANGGDQCYFFKNLPTENLTVLVRDVIINHAIGLTENGEPINAAVTGRVKIISN